jgi:hypothetical protein
MMKHGPIRNLSTCKKGYTVSRKPTWFENELAALVEAVWLGLGLSQEALAGEGHQVFILVLPEHTADLCRQRLGSRSVWISINKLSLTGSSRWSLLLLLTECLIQFLSTYTVPW